MNRTHLKSLSIKNFRTFDHLEMDGFSQINVLLGKNNTGKTSVLESIFMLAGIGNPPIAITLHLMRGFENLNKEGLPYLFHDFKTDNHPIISGIFSGETSRRLKIVPLYEKQVNVVPAAQDTTFRLIPLRPQLLGLDFFAAIKKQYEQEKSFKTWLRVENDGQIKSMLSPPTYKEDIFASFLHYVNNIKSHLELLLKEKKEHLLNDILNKFNEDFIEAIPLSDGVYINNSKIKKLVPLKLMGGGIQHFLNIVATIAAGNECNNFIYLIDEIENGLHYSTQRLLWESLLSLICSTNVQLFITTHSWEMLQSLNRVVKSDAYKNMMNNIKIFTIERTKSNGFQSYSYSAGGLDTIISNEVEIR